MLFPTEAYANFFHLAKQRCLQEVANDVDVSIL